MNKKVKLIINYMLDRVILFFSKVHPIIYTLLVLIILIPAGSLTYPYIFITGIMAIILPMIFVIIDKLLYSYRGQILCVQRVTGEVSMYSKNIVNESDVKIFKMFREDIKEIIEKCPKKRLKLHTHISLISLAVQQIVSKEDYVELKGRIKRCENIEFMLENGTVISCIYIGKRQNRANVCRLKMFPTYEELDKLYTKVDYYKMLIKPLKKNRDE